MYNAFMRDYINQPLEYGEKIDRDELYDVYIIQNYSYAETMKYFNTTRQKLKDSLKYYGFKKDPKKRFDNYKKSMLNKYGVENIFEKVDYIKQCTVDKLGVPNSSMLESTVEKRKQTNLERFGTPTPAQSDEVKAKMHKTMQERYGGNCPLASEEVKAKMRATNQERYGVAYIGSSQQVKDKRIQTCLEKYGTDNYISTDEFKEKSKETCLEKYGADHVMHVESIKEKLKQTNLERYGVENTFEYADFKEKSKQTMLKKYGVEHPMQSPEIYEQIRTTLKQNNTFRNSKAEQQVYELLCEKFSKVERQYQDDRYSFPCDFYIPEMDLFIEYQGYQGHGGHPNDPYNAEDVAKVNEWLDRSRELNSKGEYKSQYLTYHYVWTVSDVKKRRCAKEQGLNWLEFFNLKEFMVWYKELDK